MRTHSGEKPYRCTVEGCFKAYGHRESLKSHIQSHSGVRPYACREPDCKKTFSDSSGRSKHQKTHLKIRRYSCCCAPGCEKKYTCSSSLRRHRIKYHTQN
jgi:uncharacterized Zn-finger protein